MRTEDFKIKKEAVWAITNATSSGTSDQIHYLVNKAIKNESSFTPCGYRLVICNFISLIFLCEQIQQVSCGCIQPICDFLTVVDSDIVQVALNALENILRAGEKFESPENPYAVMVEECGGELKKKNPY